jgi:tripartite-type tricarboxylate transporter receptor subunit TctC
VSIPASAQFVKSGKLKALAVSTRTRSAVFPEVPTMIESGFADFEVDSWYALFAPARTPAAIVSRLHAAMTQALREPEIREKLLAQGAEAVGSSPEELGAVVRSEIPKWKRLVRDAKITP